MAKEVQSDEINKLILLGEEKGFLTYDDVNDALLPDVTSSEQIDDIIMLFGEKNMRMAARSSKRRSHQILNAFS